MAVPLKKPEKVDLSKPELPRKLPEYTPIHLIDEEETIKSRPVSTKPFDLETSEPDEAPAPQINKIDIDLECSDLEFHRKNLDISSIIFNIVFFAVCIAFIALIIFFILTENVPVSVDSSNPFEVVFSIVSAFLNWIIHSPVCSIIFAVSLLMLLVRSLKNITHF